MKKILGFLVLAVIAIGIPLWYAYASDGIFGVKVMSLIILGIVVIVGLILFSIYLITDGDI